MLAAITHPSRVLNLDMKAKLCMPKSYISLQTVLFRPSGPYQCSADARREVRPYSHVGSSKPCQSAQTRKTSEHA